MKLRSSLPLLLAVIAVLVASTATAAPRGVATVAATNRSVFVPLTVTKGFPPSVPTPQPENSALQLIETALQAGTINLETALLYKAQAVVGDPQLPAQFRGSGTGDDAQRMMNDIGQRIGALSTQAQQRIRPYLLPPADPASWYAQNVAPASVQNARTVQPQAALSWKTITTQNAEIKVWYHPEHAGVAERASKIANEIDRVMWNKLLELFGRETRGDCGSSCTGGGGDAALDLYLIQNAAPYAWDVDYGEQQIASFMVVNQRTSFAQIAATLSWHFIYTYNINMEQYDYAWLVEALPQYAIHYVYPQSNQDPDIPRTNEEHPWAKRFLARPDLSLEELTQDGHQDGAYLLYLYMNKPALVRATLEGATNPNSLAVLNNIIEGGLTKEWRYFAIHNYNKEPIPSYHDDGLTTGAAMSYDVSLQGAGKHVFPIEVNHLAAKYYHFAFPDQKVRRITFNNPVATVGQEGGHVWAILRRADGSQWFEDWATVDKKIFCRDNPAENITDVVLVVSNGQWQNRQNVLKPGDGMVETELNCGCADWFVEWNIAASGQGSTTYAGGGSATEQRTISIKGSAEVELRKGEFAKAKPFTLTVVDDMQSVETTWRGEQTIHRHRITDGNRYTGGPDPFWVMPYHFEAQQAEDGTWFLPPNAFGLAFAINGELHREFTYLYEDSNAAPRTEQSSAYLSALLNTAYTDTRYTKIPGNDDGTVFTLATTYNIEPLGAGYVGMPIKADFHATFRKGTGCSAP